MLEDWKSLRGKKVQVRTKEKRHRGNYAGEMEENMSGWLILKVCVLSAMTGHSEL